MAVPVDWDLDLVESDKGPWRRSCRRQIPCLFDAVPRMGISDTRAFRNDQFAAQVDCASGAGKDNIPVSRDTFRPTLCYQIVQLRNHFAQSEDDLVIVKITKQARD